jgi:hypothetical protein
LKPDFINHFSGHQVEFRMIAHDLLGKRVAPLFEIRPEPEMESHGTGFPFDEDARFFAKRRFHFCRDRIHHARIDNRRMQVARRIAALKPMNAGHRQYEGVQQAVDDVNVPARHQRERPPDLVPQSFDKLKRCRIDAHIVWPILKLDKCSVEVEKDAVTAEFID